MKRSRRQRAASKAAFALAEKLTPEQRKYRGQRAALARYDRPAFEALKANEAKREAVSAQEQAAIQLANRALDEYGLFLSNRSELALRSALRLGAIPYVNSADDQLWVLNNARLTPVVLKDLQETHKEIVDVLTRCARSIQEESR
jgi:hypothetical protein